jgi:hypothetical protein
VTLNSEARLEIEADIDGDGNIETGVFSLVGNLEITEGIRTGYIVNGRGSTVNSVTSSLLADGEAKRRGFYLDLGGGQHTYEISFTGWRGAYYENDQGNRVPVQWGNTGDDSQLTVGDATGEDPVTQMQIFFNYLRTAEIDSRRPARLQVGQYHPDGVLDDHLQVVVESPRGSHVARDYSTWDGTITLIEAEALGETVDAAVREEW